MVDFPEPVSPTRPKVSPFLIEKETLSTALNHLALLENRFICAFLARNLTVSSSTSTSTSDTELILYEYFQQATSSSPTCMSFGSFFLQRSIAKKHRGLNWQPFGRFFISGGSPWGRGKRGE